MFSLFSRFTMKNSRGHFLNKRSMRLGSVLISTVLLLGQATLLVPVIHGETPRPTQQQSRRGIPLPTPKSHYDIYKPGTSGLPLLLLLLKQADPKLHQTLIKFAMSSGLQGISQADMSSASDEAKQIVKMANDAGITAETILPKPQAIALLKQVNWAPYRPEILEFFIHQSQVLEMIPAEWGAIWIPIIHDALLSFLDQLSDDRLAEKLVDLAYLPPGTSRGDYLIAFVSKTPSLQKIGQILARNTSLSPDYRASLQRLENSIQTMTRDELVDFIVKDIGPDKIKQYQVQFGDKILAEASVGATIRASMVLPGSTERTQAIVKVVKPYVLVNLPQDLAILENLAVYFDKEHDYYQLGSIPLTNMFRDIKKALADEIKIRNEQQNFISARNYYKGNPKILIPEIYPLSNDHASFMQFINGEKITSAFKGQPQQRAVMAKRLVDVMTFDVMFSKKSEAIFHGDPHAGNVYHVLGDKDQYRIALLDWGLYGRFPRQDRLALMQLLLGVELGDAKRLHEFAGALLDQGMPTDPAKIKRIDEIIAQIIVPKEGRGDFDALSDFLFALVEEGYTTKFSLNLFTKSQLTIGGILTELDPTLKQDDYLEERITGLVKSEMPKRLLNTLFFGWNSRNYRSLLSNADLMDARKKPKTAPKPKPAPVTTTKAAALKPQLQY